jgi:DNA-binding CsgD family transcriptional regulator/tetratricopeptide (TPR) repeat protein
MAGRTVSPVFVGRSEQLDLAASILDRVRVGDPTHLLVSGEAGVGKTRFADEVSRLAGERDFAVLRGGCVAVGGVGLPYAPIAALLRDAVREMGDDVRESIGDVRLAALSGLAPLPSSPPAGSGLPPAGRVVQAASQSYLFEALLGVFQGLARGRPLLLVIEDLHWSDAATRDAIAFLVPNLAADRIGLCLTYRTDEIDRRHPLLPWLAEVGRTGWFERVDLQRFDREETARLVAAINGMDPPAEFVDRIQRRADGNAFFIEELLMAGGGGIAVGALPATVRATLTARVAAAPETAQYVLRVASVSGRRVDEEVLAAVAGMDRDELNLGLRAAIEAYLLVPDQEAGESGYAFRHALVQEAVYDEVLPGERRSVHRAYAEELAARAARSDASGASGAAQWAELAHHWNAARDDVRAADASLNAGDAASDAFAFEAAGRHYERVLELWDSVPDPEQALGIDRVELLVRAARAAEVGGDFRRMVDLLREAISGASTDPIRGALLLEQLGRALWLTGDTETALQSYQAAMNMLPTDRPTAERARVLAGMGQILMLVDRFAESLEFCDDAVAIAREVGDRRVEAHALNSRGLALAQLGRCREALPSLRQSLAMSIQLGSADDVGRGFVNLTDAMKFCSLDREALDVVEAGIEAIDRMGMAISYGPVIRDNGALIAYGIGEWAESRRFEEDAGRLDQRGRNEIYTLAYTIRAIVGRGDADADDRLARFRDLLEGRLVVEGQYSGRYALARAERALWRGDPAAAVAAADDGIGWFAGKDFAYFTTLLHATGARARADLAVRARDARGPASDVEEAVAGVDRHLDAIAEAITTHPPEPEALGELVGALRTAQAERSRAAGTPDPDAWQAAVAAWGARDRPYEAAYARWRGAEAHLERADRVAARDVLAEAWRWANEQGALPLLGEIEGLARRARLDLSAPSPTAVAGDGTPSEPAATPADRAAVGFGLTRREREVLALVAEGWTNRQIADHLFISENTAGVHVSNILGKLDASSRTEAAAIAHRMGLTAAVAEA